jgi:RHS repeat-associated protein
VKALRESALACLACVLVVLGWSSAPAYAEGSALGGTGASSLESPLVVPEVDQLLGGQPAREAEEARQASPEAVAEREASQTAYEGLDAAEASKLAERVFPEMVTRPDGGLPALPEGASVVGFPADNTVQVNLPGGKHGLIESMGPIATEVAPGRHVAMNLGLVESSGGVFEPQAPAVKVRIPKDLQSGVSLGETGVSLAPVTEAGGSVGDVEGRLDGSVVFYGGVGVGSDVDEVVKPEPDGFSEDAILRSAASPGRLVYRVGLPEGASLVKASDGSGAVDVVEDGSVISTLRVPVAHDAAGVVVPVSVSVEGDLLVLSIDQAPDAYELPILVDPEVEDRFFTKGAANNTDWHFRSEGKDFTALEGSEKWDMFAKPLHGGSEWGTLEYTAPGEARIIEFTLNGGFAKGMPSTQHVENLMEVYSSKGTESKIVLPTEGNLKTPYTETQRGLAGNTAEFLVTATRAGESNEEGKLQLERATVILEQEKGPEVSLDKEHEYVDGGKKNVFYGSGGWIGPNSGAFEFHAKDPGMGIREYHVTVEQGEKKVEESSFLLSTECSGQVCPKEVNRGFSYNSEWPNGEDTLTVDAQNGAGNSEVTQTLKVDNEPPYELTFSGLPGDHEIADGQSIPLKATAKSGGEGKPSPGIKSITLEVDGQAVGGSQGSCSGACTGKAEWTLNSENYPAGEHTLTVVATDNAGNVDKEEYHLTIHHPEGVQVGPGSVNPVTGELSMAATDVSVEVPGGALTVNRSYRSRHLEQGTEGPLGPQWSLALGGEQSIYRVSGGVVLTGGGGEEVVFESKGSGEFNSPTGDAGLTLLEKSKEGKTIFTLSENGSVTTFELPSGSSGGVWMPSSTEGPNGTNMTLYKFKLKSGVIEPTEELAPVPANVSCGSTISELKEGCRALEFEYDEGETTAKGEKQSEWGEFAGHLSKVKYIAWNGSKTKEEPVIAKYEYDKKGRLRAEWNPEIKPNPVKTIYGYDSAEHVTAVSTSGHEPLLFEQGTIPSDAGPGRLLAVAVPSAGTALGGGEAPAIETGGSPTLSSTTPKVGVKISVNLTSEKTPGKWSAGPLAFIYQWEDCNSSGKECTPIAGAVNQAYYPVAGDEGHELVAEVTALNAMGATTASSAATSTVASGTPNTPLPEPPEVGSDAVTTLEYKVPASGSGAPYELSSAKAAEWGQSDDPSGAEAMAVFPPDKPMGWPAKEYKHETVYYLDGKDRLVNVANSTGGISTIEYNRYNDVKRTLNPDDRAAALKESCTSEKECKSAELAELLSTENSYDEEGSEPGTELLSTLGPQHTVKLAIGREGKPDEETLAREHTTYSYNEGEPSKGGPYHLVTRTVDAAQTANKEEFDKRITETSYAGQEGLGWNLRKPTSVTTDPNGLHLVHTTEYNSAGEVTETKMPSVGNEGYAYSTMFGSEGSGNGQFGKPAAVAVDSRGDVWVVDDTHDKVDEFNSSGEYIRQIGSEGSGSGKLKSPDGIAIDSHNNIWVCDSGNDRIEEFNEKGEYQKTVGGSSGSGELSTPEGVAVESRGNIWVSDTYQAVLKEFNEKGEYVKSVGTKGTGAGDLEEPEGLAFDSHGNLWVTDWSNKKIVEFNEKDEYVRETKLEANPYGIAIDSHNNVLVIAPSSNDVEVFNEKGEYKTKFGSKGSGAGEFDFQYPEGLTVSATGRLWIVDSLNHRIQKWLAPSIATGNVGAHDTKTIYYTAKEEASVAACRNRPEWAGLPCQTAPVAQPGTSGLPELPVKTTTYDVWDQPEAITETVGSTKRTTTYTYDEAGRLKTTAVSSTVGEPMSAVTDEYNSETGVLEKQCMNEGKPCTEGKPKTITSKYNRLGQLVSYTDSGENTTKYEYEGEGSYTGEKEHEGHLRHVNNGKGSETYAYSETTGLPTEEVYENGTTKLTFTATYDVEGNMLTEGYPNNMTAIYTYNQIGRPTSLEYKKNAYCAKTCPEVWFSDSVTPSIHGQWLEQTSSLSHQVYAYDQAGRLTEVQSTTSDKCTTRLYSYDEDTNRTSLTTRESSTEKCATEGGTIQEHTYDTADRLTDSGIAYNTFGDVTALPAKDSEESGAHELTSSYYVDNEVASQKQNKQTIGYNLDPAGRTLEVVSTGEPTNSTVVNHYAGPGNSPVWTESGVLHEWSRNIAGINGTLAAIQNNGETPVLQLTNLQGDLIAKASASETTTKLLAEADTTEYGVPTVSAPAKYSWLGAIELPTELPSGVTTMGVRSYVPQIGRFLQPDPVPGGSANAYAYTFGDPVNTDDPTGAYVECAYCTAYNDNQNREAVERENVRIAAREAAAREAAERAAAEAAAEAAMAGPQYEGGEEWEEWGEEEGEYEYVSDRHDAEGGQEEHHIEPAILVQPLSGEDEQNTGQLLEVKGGPGGEAAGESTTRLGSTIPLCTAGSEGPCARDARGGEGTVYRGRRPRYSNVPSGNACVGLGTTAAYVSPFAPELAGVLIGVFLAARC